MIGTIVKQCKCHVFPRFPRPNKWKERIFVNGIVQKPISQYIHIYIWKKKNRLVVSRNQSDGDITQLTITKHRDNNANETYTEWRRGESGVSSREEPWMINQKQKSFYVFEKGVLGKITYKEIRVRWRWWWWLVRQWGGVKKKKWFSMATNKKIKTKKNRFIKEREKKQNTPNNPQHQTTTTLLLEMKWSFWFLYIYMHGNGKFI